MPKKQKERQNQKQEQKASQAQPEVKQKKESERFSLYAFLQVERNATKEEIKKQYKKLVLQYHPDKNKEDPTARQKFQKLKQAYDILYDDQKRKQYDETGQFGDQFNQNSFQSAYEYFRKMFKKIEKQDIVQFEKKYRLGPMQQEDLLNYYEEHQGDMIDLLEFIPLSTNEDIPRFIDFFETKIKEKVIEKFKKFDKTKGKVRKLIYEQAQAQQIKKGFGDLVLAIRSKNEPKVDFLQSLELKYGVGKKQKAPKTQKAEKKEKDQSIPKQNKKAK